MSERIRVFWYSSRNCKKCNGTGWIMGLDSEGRRAAVEKCDCLRRWTNEPIRKVERRDGKLAAVGSE